MRLSLMLPTALCLLAILAAGYIIFSYFAHCRLPSAFQISPPWPPFNETTEKKLEEILRQIDRSLEVERRTDTLELYRSAVIDALDQKTDNSLFFVIGIWIRSKRIKY